MSGTLSHGFPSNKEASDAIFKDGRLFPAAAAAAVKDSNASKDLKKFALNRLKAIMDAVKAKLPPGLKPAAPLAAKPGRAIPAALLATDRKLQEAKEAEARAKKEAKEKAEAEAAAAKAEAEGTSVAKAAAPPVGGAGAGSDGGGRRPCARARSVAGRRGRGRARARARSGGGGHRRVAPRGAHAGRREHRPLPHDAALELGARAALQRG